MRKARFICIAIIMMVFFAQGTFFLVNKQLCNFAVIKERILIFYGT